MKRVLLTGASGFIGHHCVEPLIARGYEIHAVSSRPQQDNIAGMTWHQIDLFQPDSVQILLDQVHPTHLLHLAWYVVPGQLISSVENYRWVTSSMDLVQRFAQHGGHRLVICGSAYEYDWNYGYCSERLTPLIPNTVYGACKHALGMLVESFSNQAGLSAAWGRVFFLYGPYEHPDRLVPSVIRSLLIGQPARCSHGRQIRDYMHVQDVASGLVALLDSPITGAVNISSAQATTLREIVLIIARILGNPQLIQLGAIPARPNDVVLVVGDNSRLVSEVGWQQAFALESGLQHTIDWWRVQSRG